MPKNSKRSRNGYVKPQEIVAEYVCLSCSHAWREHPRGSPRITGPTRCQSCGSLYVQWANWNEVASIAGAMLDVELEAFKRQERITT